MGMYVHTWVCGYMGTDVHTASKDHNKHKSGVTAQVLLLHTLAKIDTLYLGMYVYIYMYSTILAT